MKCPFCGNIQTKVLDTGKEESGRVRRRRVCPACKKRFNTDERPALGLPLVVKSDGSRQEYEREKVERGIRISCAKRPVATEKIQWLLDDIEKKLILEGKPEVSSRMIGDMVIAGLKTLDQIAYIRYAIVYLRLDDLKSLRLEIDHLLGDCANE